MWFGRRSPAARASVSTATGHIGCNSRGGPGNTTIVGLPGTTTPGAVPHRVDHVRPCRDHRLLAVGRAHRVEVDVVEAGPSDV